MLQVAPKLYSFSEARIFREWLKKLEGKKIIIIKSYLDGTIVWLNYEIIEEK